MFIKIMRSLKNYFLILSYFFFSSFFAGAAFAAVG